MMTERAPLIVKMVPTGVDDDVTPLLCDEHGEPLPCQIAVAIDTRADDLATVTVTFGAVKFR